MSNTDDSTRPAHRVPPYRRPIIVVSFLILLAIAGIVTVFIFTHLYHHENTVPESNSPGASPSTPLSPEELTDPDLDNLPDDPEDKTVQYEGEDPNTLPELTGHLAYKAVNREANYQSLTVAASIDQYLSDSGTCALRLLNSAGSVVASATLPAQPDVTTSACGPFELSISDLSRGTYRIEITVTGDGKTGLITEGVEL